MANAIYESVTMKAVLIAMFAIFIASVAYAGGNDSLKIADSVKLSNKWKNWPTWYGDTINIKKTVRTIPEDGWRSYMLPRTKENSDGWYDDDWFQYKYNWMRYKSTRNRERMKLNFEGFIHGNILVFSEDIT